jgi:cyanophycin synthetase
MSVLDRGTEELRVRARRIRSWGDLAYWAGVGPTVRHARATGNDQNVGNAAVEQALERIWREAAEELGATCVSLGRGFLELRLGSKMTRVRRSMLMLDDGVTLELALDKEIGHRLLTAANLPVPDYVSLEDADITPAMGLLARSAGGCVVKPSASFAGRGITCNVLEPRELKVAVRRAAGFGYPVLVEQMMPGENYRFTLLEGELLDVVHRARPRVLGNGEASIAELIRLENARRIAQGGAAGLGLVRLDLDCVLTLKRQGLTLSSVPARGEELVVKNVVNDNGVDDNRTVREEMSPDLIEEVRAAADALGVRFAGVDLLTPDLSKGLREAGGAINEVNTTPDLLHHYEVADRARASRIAVPILRRLLELTPAWPPVALASSA